MANFIGGLVLGALGGGFISLMLMALLVASSEVDKVEKCKNSEDLCFKSVETKVDIVRCKDCVYANEKGDTCYFGEGRFVTPEHFCGYAERKTEND